MAEILLMKSIKLFIAFICYFGTGFIIIDQALEGAINDALSVNPVTQKVILYLLIFFWVVKIGWFVFDKFYLERKERLQAMDKVEEEINDLKNN